MRREQKVLIALIALTVAGCSLEDVRTCKTGETRCIGSNVLNTCHEDGDWYLFKECVDQKCGENSAGVAACIPICNEKETRCNKNGKLEVCTSSNQWSEMSCDEGEACIYMKNEAKCAELSQVTCETEMDYCAENSLYHCKDNSVTLMEKCGSKTCGVGDSGKFECIAECVAGTSICEGNSIVTCSASGTYSSPKECGSNLICSYNSDGNAECIEKKDTIKQCDANSCKDGKLLRCIDGLWDSNAQSCGDNQVCGLNSDNKYACVGDNRRTSCQPKCEENTYFECDETGAYKRGVPCGDLVCSETKGCVEKKLCKPKCEGNKLYSCNSDGSYDGGKECPEQCALNEQNVYACMPYSTICMPRCEDNTYFGCDTYGNQLRGQVCGVVPCNLLKGCQNTCSSGETRCAADGSNIVLSCSGGEWVQNDCGDRHCGQKEENVYACLDEQQTLYLSIKSIHDDYDVIFPNNACQNGVEKSKEDIVNKNAEFTLEGRVTAVLDDGFFIEEAEPKTPTGYRGIWVNHNFNNKSCITPEVGKTISISGKGIQLDHCQIELGVGDGCDVKFKVSDINISKNNTKISLKDVNSDPHNKYNGMAVSIENVRPSGSISDPEAIVVVDSSVDIGKPGYLDWLDGDDFAMMSTLSGQLKLSGDFIPHWSYGDSGEQLTLYPVKLGKLTGTPGAYSCVNADLYLADDSGVPKVAETCSDSSVCDVSRAGCLDRKITMCANSTSNKPNYICSADDLYVCNDHKWKFVESYENGECGKAIHKFANVVESECKINSYRCDNMNLQQCVEKSDQENSVVGWKTVKVCGISCNAATQSCDGKNSVECSADAAYCDNYSKTPGLYSCQNEKFIKIDSCQYPSVCDANRLMCVSDSMICTPGAVRCGVNMLIQEVQVCQEDGSGWKGFKACKDENTYCDPDMKDCLATVSFK